ncbi:short-chain dehydrogenase [Paractinoplanes abujensis]|uniref:NAD(P)-dependent dehydrogenase (Short-subunit alcohol dehydrogenase family) n=1 Tax=Paractinoplanes abujensis TaxID=882441 RepID=A0A7W7CUT8_9ACTN|nr:SDR family oxidoreductase [Actinoplanes abujensis]MBB4693396.1 NAD(P)-dependent dehydrogenase (short-subunit alcohol dehydrogenase family) [Actinoplanes abujensis]GID24600.1 short-chain dehydrogenase [Actinoplanes abujensis]
MDLQLVGKRVLVTGASKGIGLATVRAFLAEGATVVGTSRTLTAELEATGAAFVAADLSGTDGARRMVEAVLEADPRLDVLVNNAGGGEMPLEAFGDPLDGDEDVWDTSLGLNLRSAVRVTRAALPALTEAKGSIVNVSSHAGRAMSANPLHYVTAKAGLNMFSRALAEKLAPSGVRVNVVSPAATRTNLTAGKDGFLARAAGAMGVDHAALLAGAPEQTGMLTGQLAEPDEIARAILLLSSPAMPSLIGTNLLVDGGAVKVA